MSAFLASQQTYNYIASCLYHAASHSDSEHHYTVRQFLAIAKGATDETLTGTIAIAVCKLHDLNRLALVTRYGDQWDREDIFEPVITCDATIHLAQFITCIGCVLYQCSEYLTDETDTYKRWHDLELQLAFSYFERSPENEATEWNMAA